MARPVDRRGLVELRVNAGDRRDVDDRIPAQHFPQIQQRLKEIDDVPVDEQVLARAEHGQQAVHRPFRRKQRVREAINDDPADEIRQRAHRLNNLAEAHVADLVEQNREHGGADQHDVFRRRVDQRVLERPRERRRAEQADEIVEADELALQNGRADAVFDKCEIPSGQRHIAKRDHQRHQRQDQKEQIPAHSLLVQSFLCHPIILPS